MKFALEDKFAFGDSYVFDTNVLITLLTFYPKDKPTFRALWDEIESLIKKKIMFSTDVVYKEINRYRGKNDIVKKWAKSHRKSFFIPPDKKTWQYAQDIMKNFPDLLDKKKLQTGEPDADPFLIALAKSEGATIITQERKDLPNRIPMVASQYRVKSIDLYEFFEERKLKFVKEQ
jgi:predicted nucleic acid-binding protein